MARFDVYANLGSHAKTTPYLLDVQSDLLDDLESRVVIPLRSLQNFPKVNLPTRLTPTITIDRNEFLLETPKMAAVPKRTLQSPVASLGDVQDEITAALDFLFYGF